MNPPKQGLLFPDATPDESRRAASSSTFGKNMSLPVHRWFRYSAGFSADWVEGVIRAAQTDGPVQVFDPFAGSGTTLLAAESMGVASWGLDSHPFVWRIARAKLEWRSDPEAYRHFMKEVRSAAITERPDTSGYPPLIHKCYDAESLAALDVLRRGYELVKDGSPASELAWLTIIAILREVSNVGTAQWQYILPRKQKRSPKGVERAFDECSRMIYRDMLRGQDMAGPRAQFDQTDARTCASVPDGFANVVITSPPYPNNYDYADATRLEMSFMQEISGWGDLQQTVRRHLIRSCSQHVPERSMCLEDVLVEQPLAPIRTELSDVCNELGEVRKSKGGKKTYHLMVACYFRDLALVWQSLRRVCREKSTVCFVIGDSAPYGVYVPVIPWLGTLALAAGFKSYRFEKTRDRNIKWKNRKHRVPLQEGRLWVEG